MKAPDHRMVKNVPLLTLALVALVLLAPMACQLFKTPYEPPTDEEGRKIAEAMPDEPTADPKSDRKILVFSLCQGYAHGAIPTCDRAMMIMAEKTGAFEVVFSKEMSAFEPENLARFDAVLFNNTTQLKFENPAHREALMGFVKEGKGIIGIHAATDSFYDWPEAAEMMGGLFDGHPWTAGGTWAMKIDEPDHPLNAAFEDKGFLIKDEIYQIKGPYSRDTHRVLISLDMTNPRNHQVKGMKRDDGDNAISWIRTFGKGRVFYCSLGHNHEIYWNPAVLRHYLDGIQYALGDLEADDAPSSGLTPEPVPALTTEAGAVDDLFQRIASYEYGDSRLFLTFMEAEVQQADPAEWEEIEGRLLQILESPEATVGGKQFACRMLRRAGTVRAVPVLASLLDDDKLSDPARFALQGYPYPEVDEAFHDALQELDGDLRIGVIGSVAQRGDRSAVPILAEWVDAEDPDLAGAAIDALGTLGGAEAGKVLMEADQDGGLPAGLDVRCDHACIRCGESLLVEGKTDEARALFQAMNSPDNPASVRVAALWGCLMTESGDATGQILDLLRSDDPVQHEAACMYLSGKESKVEMKTVADALTAFPPEAQILVIGFFGRIRYQGAAQPVMQVIQDGEEPVRVAGLRALAGLGDASHVEFLARTAAYGGADGEAAAYSLDRLSGTGTDEAILDRAVTFSGPVRIALIRSMEARRIDGTTPLLLAFGADLEPHVRHAALRALKVLASEEDLPGLLSLSKALSDEKDLKRMEAVLLAVCSRMEDEEARVRPLIETLQRAKPLTRACLLTVLGRLPCEGALQALYEGLEDQDPVVREAAVEALAAWPDPAPMDALLDVARATPEENLRSEAVDGYLRLAGLTRDRPPDENRIVFTNAMALARSPEEKEQVLDRVAGVAQPWVLDFIEPCLEDAEICERAVEMKEKALTALARTGSHDGSGCSVTLAYPCVDRYNGGNKNALTDDKWGSADHGDGMWQGFEGNDLDAVIDLGKEVEISSIRVGMVKNHHSWIFLPTVVDISLSLDNEKFTTVARLKEPIPTKEEPAELKDFFVEVKEGTARYVRVVAKNVGTCPKWHSGAGGKTWLFATEIQVNPRYAQ